MVNLLQCEAIEGPEFAEVSHMILNCYVLAKQACSTHFGSSCGAGSQVDISITVLSHLRVFGFDIVRGIITMSGRFDMDQFRRLLDEHQPGYGKSAFGATDNFGFGKESGGG